MKFKAWAYVFNKTESILELGTLSPFKSIKVRRTKESGIGKSTNSEGDADVLLEEDICH